MKELHYYILKLSGILFCICMFMDPIYVSAQDENDTSLAYSDSAGVEVDGENFMQHIRSGVSDEAILRSVPDTTVARMKKEKEFAYANDPAYWVKEKVVYRKGFWDYVFEFFESSLVRVIFYVLVAGLVIFVLYRIIVVNELLIFYTPKKQKKIFEETESSELDPRMIDQKIDEAIQQQKYHTAVRYLYLKTLYLLNDKNLIQFHTQATNNEYLAQMNQHKQLKEFRFLTQVYEYVWYGKFEISEHQFSIVHHSFKNFQGTV